jgi:CheY-like chemotaxis protein
MKVLIVDNSASMRRLIRLVVKDLAQEVFECADGSEALAVYAANQPDWVLMDIRMDTVDGLTATRQIKAAFPEARIIIVTVCKGSDMKEAARSAGAMSYVVKDNLLELQQILTERVPEKSNEIAS